MNSKLNFAMTPLIAVLAAGVLLLGSWGAIARAQGETASIRPGSHEQVLYSFSNAPGADYHSVAGLISDAAGNLYGTTDFGGSRGGGAVFELSPQSGGGWTQTVLHNFHSDSQDGSHSWDGLIFDASGNLYGTTPDGGVNGKGAVFELSPQSGGGWSEQILYSLGYGPDGSQPFGGLVSDTAGNLYGTTEYGGADSDGTVFELSP